jgi:hypothetical protein
VSDDRTILKLKHPVKLGENGELVEQLAFRRGRMGDLKGVVLSGEDRLPWDSIITIASRMTGQFPQFIELLDEEDVGEVTRIVVGFYIRCQETGMMG